MREGTRERQKQSEGKKRNSYLKTGVLQLPTPLPLRAPNEDFALQPIRSALSVSKGAVKRDEHKAGDSSSTGHVSVSSFLGQTNLSVLYGLVRFSFCGWQDIMGLLSQA